MKSSVSVSAASRRLQATAALDEDIARLKYVSGAREDALRRMGLERVRDLLLHTPRRYLDFTHAYTIECAPIGEVATIVATVDRVRVKRPRPRMQVVEVSLVDDTGVLNAAFFRQPWLAKQLTQGTCLALFGKVEFFGGFKQMSSPHIERLDAEGRMGSMLPVHPVREGISPAWMRRIVATALEATRSCVDVLPARLRAQRSLMSASRALRTIHFPQSCAEVEQARMRLAYDELFYLQLALRLRNDANLLDVRPYAHVCSEHVRALRDALPFALTDEQERAVQSILDDMADGSHVMNRLLLGDVGTGKTVVAAFSLAAVADSGTQAAVMAPTSVLASQYVRSLGALLDKAGISWALLTGSTPASEREGITRRLAAGELTVVFGTQALLSPDVIFSQLSCVVIDEQHRFGVGQRNALRSKGPGADLLIMTATPIPRTLALSLYGDLETSVIRHRPHAGAGITTKVLTEPNRDIAYGAIREARSAGHQVYVICPLVDASDTGSDLGDAAFADDATEDDAAPAAHDAIGEAERLRQVFPLERIEVLHGRMGTQEKDAVMGAFHQGEIGILVSTTVVEVGVDVPNATVMVIENAERFGLAALHQLRGRVGRGSVPGTCFAITKSLSKKASDIARQRLQAFEATSDGFALAEMDLRLRHEGEIMGYRQSGGVTLRFVDLDSDTELIEAAHEDAIETLRYSRDLGSCATRPLRHEVVARYGALLTEVSGG